MRRISRRLPTLGAGTMNSVMAKACFSCIIACAAFIGGCDSKTLDSGPIDGQVVDAVSRKPIAGAVVLAKWGRAEGLVTDNVEVCRHVAIASTDAQGRYHLDRWLPGSGVSHGPLDSSFSVFLDVYKAGMIDARQGVIKGDEMTSTMELVAWRFTHEQRMNWLRTTISSSELSCNGAVDSADALMAVRETIYQEAKSIATNEADDQKIIEYMEDVRSSESMQKSGKLLSDTPVGK